MQLKFCPGNFITEVKSIEQHHEELAEARLGNNVGFNIKNFAAKDLRRGYVFSDAKNYPSKECDTFDA